MTQTQWRERLSRGPVILDGATGSGLRRAGMPADAVAELWVLEHPEPLLTLQRAYREAGSHILYAPTFQATPPVLARYGMEDRTEELNARLVGLTKQAAEGVCLVAGDMTTMAAVLSPGEPCNYETMVSGYARQLLGLVDGGADLAVAETLVYSVEGQAILEAAGLVAPDFPIVISYTMDAGGVLFTGEDGPRTLGELERLGAAAVGFNCVPASEKLGALVSRIRRQVRGPLLAKANAGIPRIQDGQAHYHMEPEEFAVHEALAYEMGAMILGGCCGTEPRHIRALAERIGAVNRTGLPG